MAYIGFKKQLQAQKVNLILVVEKVKLPPIISKNCSNKKKQRKSAFRINQEPPFKNTDNRTNFNIWLIEHWSSDIYFENLQS